MARGRMQRAATVGVAEHGNSAVLVTVAPGGELLVDDASTSLIAVCRRTRITTKGHGRSAVTETARGRGRFRSPTPWR